MKLVENFNPDYIKDKLVKVKIDIDISNLTENQKKLIKILIEVSKIIDQVFLLQKYKDNLIIKKEIEKTNNKSLIDFFNIMYGPFDMLNNNTPYIEGIKKIDTAGFYPEDITIEEWNNLLKNNPDKEKIFQSPYTVIIREKNRELKAINYSHYYYEYLEKASFLLTESLKYVDNISLKSYLQSLSAAFLNNDFEEADIRWLQLENNDIEPLIGPEEYYEDRFLGYKTSFTSFIMLVNKEENKKLAIIQRLMDNLQQSLPIPDHYKKIKRGQNSKILITNLIYNAGDARGPIQTAAFNLPNSLKIKINFGSKKILIFNIMEAKFNYITFPLSKIILDANSVNNVNFISYFNLILMHEISHELGIGFIKDEDGNLQQPSFFLKELYTIIEEAKADVMGVYLLIYLIKKCYISDCSFIEVATTYLVNIFRSIRFGKENAHGIANIIQWNFLKNEDVFIQLKDSDFLSIDFHRFEKSIEKLLTIILTFLGEGNYNKVNDFINLYSKETDLLLNYLEKINSLPIDILPEFTIENKI